MIKEPEHRKDKKNPVRLVRGTHASGISCPTNRTHAVSNSAPVGAEVKGYESDGVARGLSCGGHFRQRITKTVVIRHHRYKIIEDTKSNLPLDQLT